MTLRSLASALRAEAQRANERRVLVLAGDAAATREAALDAIDAADLPIPECTAVSAHEDWPFEYVAPRRSSELLGRTQQAIVLDGHDECSPNATGRTVGAVDGGGLYIILVPPLDEWPDRRDTFDESLAVPPFAIDDVGGSFRRRLVGTLRDHPGVAICRVDDESVEKDGLTDPFPARDQPTPAPPEAADFPDDAYTACRTEDQTEAVHALEALRDEGAAVVVEADRGRGKSSAAGLAAGALAREGHDVLVTATDARSASEVFARARDLLAGSDDIATDSDLHIESVAGGVVRFARPPEAADFPSDPDAVIVDEAASLPVALLERFLDGPPVAFCTTVHGYEGAGRSFDVRFRDSLAESGREVVDVRLDDPIRYAAGDPVESWAFRALLLDARPPVDPLVADVKVRDTEYAHLTTERLLADEHLLREAFGLLVLAHYRTEPDDLARLLDAPNLTCRALLADGHVVSVALLAREGGLDAETRESMYEGGRVRGNMLPDVFTSQLRDEEGGVPVGYRVMRIATHHAVRSSGLGSRLLDEIRAEFSENDGVDADLRGEEVDYLGVGYGATPGLLRFWWENGYGTVHLSTTRNDASGEYSALMLRPLTESGAELRARHTRWFRERIAGVLGDPLTDADPDVVRGTLRAVDSAAAFDGPPKLSERDWRVVVDAAHGTGTYLAAPEAFRTLALRDLIQGDANLDARAERLLVEKLLQSRSWDRVADDLGFVSTRMTMKAFGEVCETLVDAYGGEVAREYGKRYE